MKKILIIYEKAGSGHLKTAQVLMEALNEEGNDIKLITPFAMQGLAFDNFFSTKFLKLLRKFDCPWLVDFLFDYIQRIFLQPWLIALGLKKFEKVIRDKYNPDIIISTISGINNTLAFCAKKLDRPFFVFITDISVYADVLSKNAVHLCYFPETSKAISGFSPETFCLQPLSGYSSMLRRCLYPWLYILHHGIGMNAFYRNVCSQYPELNKLECHSIGILRDKKFFEAAMLDKIVLKKKLSIDLQQPCILISGGGWGGRFIRKTLLQLNSKFDSMTVVPLCGTDEKLFNWINKFKTSERNKLTIIPMAFVDNIHEYLRASDVVVSRGTTGMFLESIICRTPLIVRDNIEKHDRGTVEIIRKYSLGAVYKNADDFSSRLIEVINKKEYFYDKIEKFIDLNSDRDYHNIEEKIREIICGTQRK